MMPKALRISGRSLATGAIPSVQRVIPSGRFVRDMHHTYTGLWCFLYIKNFRYFPEGGLEVCLGLSVTQICPYRLRGGSEGNGELEYISQMFKLYAV